MLTNPLEKHSKTITCIKQMNEQLVRYVGTQEEHTTDRLAFELRKVRIEISDGQRDDNCVVVRVTRPQHAETGFGAPRLCG